MTLRNTIAAVIIAVTASTAQAQDATPLDVCTSLGDLADAIMDARQSGTPMSKLMGVFDGPNNDLARTFVMAAYDIPRYNTPSIVAEIIMDFRSDAELSCFNAFGE